MITLIDSEPDQPLFPWMEEYGCSSKIPRVYGLNLSKLKGKESPGPGDTLLIRAASPLLSKALDLICRGYNLVFPASVLGTEAVEGIIRILPERGRGLAYLIHPWIFHPCFLNLARIKAKFDREDGNGVLQRGRILYRGGQNLILLKEAVWLLEGPEGLGKVVWEEWPANSGSLAAGTLNYLHWTADFNLGDPGSLSIKTEKSLWEVSLPEGSGVYYSLLDLLYCAEREKESEIYPLLGAVKLRNSPGIVE